LSPDKIRVTITKERLVLLARGQALRVRMRDGGEIEVVMDAQARILAKFADLMNTAVPGKA
jgi:hypothetical protein